MIRKILSTFFLSLALLAIFLVTTFPFSRLGPKIQRDYLVSFFEPIVGGRVSCDLDGFDFSLVSGFQWKALSCQSGGNNFIEMSDASLSVFFTQTLSGKMGKGRFTLKTNAGLRSAPSRVQAEFNQLPLEKVTPLLMIRLNRGNPLIPTKIKIEGTLTGKLDLPLRQWNRETGMTDLRFDKLALPSQPLLDLIGLKEIIFSKSIVKAELVAGKFRFVDTAFLSNTLSGKADGQLELAEDLMKSAGALNLKWKVQRSDALLSAPFGQVIANAPCPSPDSEGFCTRRINRLAELSTGF